MLAKVSRLLLAACLVATGLIGGAGTATAQDAPAPTTGDSGNATGVSSWRTYLPTIGKASPTVPNCRFGVAGSTVNQIDNLGAGALVTFGYRALAALPADVEFIPMVRLKQDRGSGGAYLPSYTVSPPLTPDGLGAAVDRLRGALWLIGNEPDRVYHQDDIYPDMYAVAYHDVYQFIKQRDPSAQIGIAGLVQVSPGRLQYLDLVWAAYQAQYGTTMPVDVWNMHAYIFPEKNADGTTSFAAIALGTDPGLAWISSGGNGALCSRADVVCIAEHDDMALFAEQVRNMRQWMRNHGQQNKPLIVSEYSLLYPYMRQGSDCSIQDESGRCFEPERVNEFMAASMNYLNNTTDVDLGYPLDNHRLVQQSVWFSLDDFGGGNGMDLNPSLLLQADDAQLTAMGLNYKNLLAQQARDINLTVGSLSAQPAGVAELGASFGISLTAKVFNNGNVTSNKAVVVTFYSDAAMTQPIGSTTIPAGLGGCALQSATATVWWNNLTPGAWNFWVKVDAGNVLSESNEQDNTSKGTIVLAANLRTAADGATDSRASSR